MAYNSGFKRAQHNPTPRTVENRTTSSPVINVAPRAVPTRNVTNLRGKRPVNTKTFTKPRPKGVIAILIAAVIAIFAIVRTVSYNSYKKENVIPHVVTEDLGEAKGGEDSGSFVARVKEKGTSCPAYEMEIDKGVKNAGAYIFGGKKKCGTINKWKENDKTVFCFDIKKDCGTNIKGKYYIADVNGTQCVIDEAKEKIYPTGTEQYDKCYERLMLLTYDNVCNTSYLENKKIITDEYGLNKKSKCCNYNIRYEEDAEKPADQTGELKICENQEDGTVKILKNCRGDQMVYTTKFMDGSLLKLPNMINYKIEK